MPSPPKDPSASEEVKYLLSEWFLKLGYLDLPQELRERMIDATFRSTKSRLDADQQVVSDSPQFDMANGSLFYVPSRNALLAKKLTECFPNLGKVEVVPCTTSGLVSRVGAIQLCEILKEMRSSGSHEVHLGFYGGRTPMLLAKDLAQYLSLVDALRPPQLSMLFPKLVFHSMVGSVAFNNQATDPNGYSSYFISCPKSVRDLVEFRSLPAPGIVLNSERDAVRKIHLVQQSLKAKLDIVISSCGHCPTGEKEDKEHFSFWNTLNANCSSNPSLQEAWAKVQALLYDKHVVGDFAWLPISRDEGVLELDEFPLWAFTMFGKKEMFDFVDTTNRGPIHKAPGKILLLAGPCGNTACKIRDKSEILQSLLRNRFKVSHLVVDSLTAEELVRKVR